MQGMDNFKIIDIMLYLKQNNQHRSSISPLSSD